MTIQTEIFSWDKFCGLIRREYGDSAYKNWFSNLHFDSGSATDITLRTPSKLVKNWVQTHYINSLVELAQKINPEIQSVNIEHKDDVAVSVETADDLIQKSQAQSSYFDKPQHKTDDFIESFASLDKNFTFDQFVLDDSNELAYAAARRIAENDDVQFNPLFFFSGVGLGKTHLMHAIAWRIRERNPERRVVYLTAEKFMYRFIRALRHKNTVDFKEQFRSVDVLMIDDLQFISGKESTQEEFFHTFNALVDQHKQVILAADKSPYDLTGIGERLKSRLGSGLVADIHSTSYNLRLGIIESKSKKFSVAIPQDVKEFLAENITSNVRELEGALNRVFAYAELINKPLSIPLIRGALKDLLRSTERKCTVEDIQKEVCSSYDLSISDMHSPRRSRVVARPRQMAMYLAKVLTTKSFPDIGRAFGGRDHTTVMHAVTRIQDLIERDQEIKSAIERIENSLRYMA